MNEYRPKKITHHGKEFAVAEDPVVEVNLADFQGHFEDGTLEFFDAVMPGCTKMFDFGSFFGFISLYCATELAEVHAFEPSATNHRYLQANVGVNPSLAQRITVHNYGLGPADARVPIYSKSHGDSGSSIFKTVQRGKVVEGTPDGEIEIRNGAEILRELGVDHKSIIKIDIEGAEFDLIPAIAPVLAEAKPTLHISFHPFNLLAGSDEYLNSLLRLRKASKIAEDLAFYPYMYLWTRSGWLVITKAERAHFLEHYFSRPKRFERVVTLQYGFSDSIGFSMNPIPQLRAVPATPTRLRAAMRQPLKRRVRRRLGKLKRKIFS